MEIEKDKKNTFIIAELSANHNNDFDLTVKTIKAIAESGADAVKVQTFTADSLTLDCDNEYFGPRKVGLWKGWRPYDLFKKAALPYDWHYKIKEIAEELGLIFFSSPFDKDAVDFLEKLGVDYYKIASLEITDIPLIKYVAEKKKSIIISTGVAGIEDINLALKTCRDAGNNNISLLKCTSQYPAEIDDANLLMIPEMQKMFEVEIGVSDHTMGYIVPSVAVSLGAKIVEKHFILDRALGGPDSAFSMEPAEFKLMVENVRKVERTLGIIDFTVTDKDKNRRRSLFAVEDIKKGEILTEKNIRSIRPGAGLHPKYLDEITGKKSIKEIKKGDPLSWDMIEK